MNSIETLAELFAKFPGIGPRQAKRFVYYLLYRSEGFGQELIRAVENLRREIIQCSSCFRYFAKNGSTASLCRVCADESRESSLLMILPRDVDLEAVEKSQSFQGRYFVLGGVVPILDKEPEKRIRLKELEVRIKSDKNLKEVILAMNANQDGEHTAEFLKERLKELSQGRSLTISELGRGLSTGAELEYADPETLKNALLHRTT